MTRRRQHASTLVVGALLSVLLGACTGGEATGEQVAGVRQAVRLQAAEDRPVAPLDVEAPVLGADGEVVSLDELVGDVVVVNFWGSWCGPCRTEQPELNAVATDFADDGVVFLGVNVDDSEGNALAHEREFEIPYDSVFDPAAEYAGAFGPSGPRAMPTTLVLDREGRVAFQLFGETDALEVSAAVNRLLGDGT